MATNIKGLVVEIGGDTTQLGKALEDVNKKSKNLSSELGQINKLLKMDPGNADLLAQKQAVLADAVQNTASKLETLKEAEKQVQEQFERGEVSADQLRALQREIITTTKKLESYEKAARETAEAMEKVGRDGQDEIEETGDAADEAADDLDEMADAAGRVEKASGTMGESLANAAKTGLKAVATVATAAVTALVAAAESTRDYRTEMGKLETAFTQQGFSSEAATSAYQDLVGVLGETDQSVEAANHLAVLTHNEKELATWTGDILPGVFATFGDSLPIEGLTEAANETAKVGEVTGPLADALNWAGISEDEFNESLAKCSDEQERQTLIMTTLASVYGNASEAYKETNAEVIRANQANDEWMSSLSKIGEVIDPIITDVKLLGASLLTELVPGVTSVAEAFRGLLNGDEGAATALGDALSGMVSDLLHRVTELAPTVVSVGVSLITSLTTSILGMLPQLLTTGVTLLMTIINGLVSAIPQLTAAIVNLIPQIVNTLVAGIPYLISGAVQLLMAIVQAVPQILPLLIQALPIIVTSIVTSLVSQVPVLLQGAVTLLLAIVQAIPQLISALVPQIPNIVSAIVSALIAATPTLLAGAVQLFMAILTAVPQIIVELIKVGPQLVIGLVQGIISGIPLAIEAILQLGKNILDSIKEFFGVHSPSTVFMEIGADLLQGLINGVKNLPTALLEAITGAVAKVTTWGKNLLSAAKTAATNMLNGVVSKLSETPAKVLSAINKAVTNVTTWGSNMVSKAKSGMQKVVSTVTSTLSGLPDKVLDIGKNLVSGLWNGISNKLSWLKSKISGFASSVLDSIKSFFGVHSPSTETAWIGKMLDEGLADGLLKYSKNPVKAMSTVSSSVLDAAEDMNGLTLERQLSAPKTSATAVQAIDSGILSKLDSILTAIEKGQVLTIDGNQLVGATASRYDSTLGQRRALAARGAV